MFRYRFILVMVGVLAVSACSKTAGALDEEEMNGLATSLTLISPTIDALAPDCEGPDRVEISQAIIDEALDMKPNVKSDLENYVLKASRVNCQAVVLLCNKDATRGYLEDAGCNLAAERTAGERLWQTSPDASCDFTLKVDGPACNLIN